MCICAGLLCAGVDGDQAQVCALRIKFAAAVASRCCFLQEVPLAALLELHPGPLPQPHSCTHAEVRYIPWLVLGPATMKDKTCLCQPGGSSLH